MLKSARQLSSYPRKKCIEIHPAVMETHSVQTNFMTSFETDRKHNINMSPPSPSGETLIQTRNIFTKMGCEA